jgi:ABC-type antimicrobial peptide transport system permease subunit
LIIEAADLGKACEMTVEQIQTINIRGWWQQLRRNSMGLIGLIMLLTAIFVALLAPWLAPYDP